jgi:hypothetical protein
MDSRLRGNDDFLQIRHFYWSRKKTRRPGSQTGWRLEGWNCAFLRILRSPEECKAHPDLLEAHHDSFLNRRFSRWVTT